MEKAYINSLYTDLEQDIFYYSNKIEEINSRISGYETFIHKAYDIQNNLEEYKALMKNVDLPESELTINNSTYIELQNTGNLNIFKDATLKKAVINLYKRFEEINKHISNFDVLVNTRKASVHEQLSFTKYLELYRESLPWDEEYMFKDDDWEYINNPTSIEFRSFEEMIGLYHNKNTVTREYLHELMSKTNDLIEQINVSVKNR